MGQALSPIVEIDAVSPETAHPCSRPYAPTQPTSRYEWRPCGRWGMRRSIKAIAGVDVRAMPEVADYLALTFTHFLPRRDRLPVFPDDVLRRPTTPCRT